MEDDITYKVFRSYFKSDKKEILETGLTLAEARAHCKDPETSSRTASSAEAIERTQMFGPWFDGYDEE